VRRAAASRASIAIAVCVGLVGLSLLAGCAAPVPPKVVVGSAVAAAGAPLSWSSPFQVQGRASLTVEAGGRLELENATVAPRAAGDALTITVRGGGELRAQDARLESVRILLEPGAAAAFTRSSLVQASGGIRARNATLSLDRVALSGSTEQALRVEGGSARLRDVTVAGSGGQLPAVQATGAVLEADRLRIDGSASYGLQVAGGLLRMRDSSVGDIADYGLQARGAVVRLHGDTWSARCGLFLLAGSDAEVEDETFRDAHRAITLDASTLLLRNATFAAASAVLGATASNVSLAQATLPGGEASFRDSALDLVGGQVGATLRFDGGSAVVRNSTWLPSGQLEGGGNASVDAAWNWWGDAAGPVSGQVLGAVRVAPWLAAPPRA
jgi:hypothetical protein